MTDLAERELVIESKGERTRRRILDIAIARFGSRGYRATSVSEIARTAGLTQAASYAYFDSKETLFRAAVDEDAYALINEVGEQVRGLPIDQLIPCVLIYAVVGLDAHPLVRRVLAGLEPDEVPRLVELPAIQLFGEMIAEQLLLAQERGEVRADLDPETTGAGVESLVMGILFSTVQSGGISTPRQQQGVVEAFNLMIRPPR